jgi:hypothetical protein
MSSPPPKTVPLRRTLLGELNFEYPLSVSGYTPSVIVTLVIAVVVIAVSRQDERNSVVHKTSHCYKI